MPEEQAAPQGEQAQPEPAVAPEVKVVETTKTVVDTSGYDAAIEALEDSRQYVPEAELQTIDARIAELQSQKVKAASSAEAEELARYRREEADRKIKEMGIDPSTVRGNTRDERLANAEMIAAAMKPVMDQVEELKKARETDAPTPEQVAAHGEPMVPGGDIPEGHDSVKNISEGIDAGDMDKVLNDPAIQAKLRRSMEAAESR